MSVIIRTLIVGTNRDGPQGPQGEAGGDNITADAPLVRTVDALSIPAATAASAGHATAAQIAKLDGIAAGATVGPTLSSTTPAAIGTAAVGSGTTVARADHVHAHGNQAAGASLHAVATSSVSGFQSSADKALDTAEHTVRAVSGTTATLAATDGYLDVTTTAGAYTVTAAGGTGVRSWVVAKVTVDANTITLARAGSETINGAASNLVLPDSDSDALPSWTVRRDASGNLRVL